MPRSGVVAALHQMGMKCVLLTGDHWRTARAIADQVGCQLSMPTLHAQGGSDEGGRKNKLQRCRCRHATAAALCCDRPARWWHRYTLSTLAPTCGHLGTGPAGSTLLSTAHTWPALYARPPALQLGISTVFAEVLPAGKVDKVQVRGQSGAEGSWPGKT